MSTALKAGVRWSNIGWLWPLALLAWPGCSSFSSGGNTQTIRGPLPQSSAVFCDIEQPPGRHCASDAEVAIGIPLSEAALALVTGLRSPVGLDDSPAARCGADNRPQAVPFLGQFPDGQAVCLNCSVIGPAPQPYPDAGAVCFAMCKDLYASNGGTGDAAAFCRDHARPSTNFFPDGGACFSGACRDSGTPTTDFLDPRRFPEPVVWQDLIGVTFADGTLTRSTATPADPLTFDAGAASSQVIKPGDGYLEFTASETDTSRLIGLATGAPPDNNPNYQNIAAAIDLFKDGYLYLFENGAKVHGPVDDPAHLYAFRQYHTGERYRITVRDNFDGTAKVVYSFIAASCLDGHPCADEPFYTSTFSAHYPLRVDSSFHEHGATLKNARIVRIR
jgi:hypothetical protein